ncbi:MAG: hypothetical protein ACLSUW_07740 [Akkermansia sp.]
MIGTQKYHRVLNTWTAFSDSGRNAAWTTSGRLFRQPCMRCGGRGGLQNQIDHLDPGARPTFHHAGCDEMRHCIVPTRAERSGAAPFGTSWTSGRAGGLRRRSPCWARSSASTDARWTA